MGTHFGKKIECTDFQVHSVSISCAGHKTILGRLFTLYGLFLISALEAEIILSLGLSWPFFFLAPEEIVYYHYQLQQDRAHDAQRGLQ